MAALTQSGRSPPTCWLCAGWSTGSPSTVSPVVPLNCGAASSPSSGWRAPAQLEALTRAMVEGFARAGGSLGEGVLELAVGRHFNIQPNRRPLPPYAEAEWQRLTEVCRKVVDDSYAAHRRALASISRGCDPGEGGWTRENFCWLLSRLGPVGTPEVAAALGMSFNMFHDRRSAVFYEAVQAMFPHLDVAIAYRLLFSVYSGVVPDGLDGLGIGDAEWAGDASILLSYVKRRTAAEKLAAPPGREPAGARQRGCPGDAQLGRRAVGCTTVPGGQMKRSTERFLTTHTGSLPRPDDLIRMMYAKEEGVPVDRAALAARVRAAVAEVVRKQADAGVDIVNDGEMSKPSYATYIKDRLTGFGGTGNTFVYQDLAEFPTLAQARVRRSRPLAPQDARLQRADQRARRRRRRATTSTI